jgi:endonuclease/exonuclease/phosphatase family metal-dependent hydrolase
MSGDLRVLTWNIFHGQDGARLRPGVAAILAKRPIDDGTFIHRNRKWVDEMADVIVAQTPTFVALQEVSPQAVDRLATRTGMHAVRALMRPLIGPTRLRGWLADRNPDLWRTHEGTCNVILAASDWTLTDRWTVRHNPPLFAFRHGRRLRIGLRERIHWILEPRRLVGARFTRASDGAAVTLVSLHCHNSLVWDVIGAEMERVMPQITRRTPANEPLIVAGDFNAAGAHHPALIAVTAAGLEEATLDRLFIDHIFQRGLQVIAPPAPVPTAARTLSVGAGIERRSVLLSDHDLVEATFRLPSG